MGSRGEDPPPLFKSMPHYKDWFVVEASKAVIHPDYRPEASSQDVGSWTLQDNTFRGPKTAQVGWDVGQAGFDPGPIGAGSDRFTTGGGGDSLTDAGLGNNSAYVDEDVDGFMKLGDIKGEFAGAYSNSLGGFKADALTNDGQEGFSEVEIHYVVPVNQTADVWTTGPVTSIKNTGPMDVWTNGSATSVQNALHSDHNHGKRSNWDVICDIGTSIKQESVAG